MIELLKSKIGLLHGAELEKFVRQLLPTVSSDYEHLTDTLNHLGRVTQGPADLHAYKQSNSRYIAVLCSGQVSGLQAKVLADIKKLTREDCAIRDQIDQVVICLSVPGSTDEAIYRSACAKQGWSTTVYALDRLAQLASQSQDLTEALCARELSEMRKKIALESPSSTVTEPAAVRERFYDCGKRVGALRARLALSPSQFIELIDYDSEKRLGALESEATDMSASAISKVCEATGVSSEWLIHAKGSMFLVDSISTCHWAEMKKLRDANPESVHMLVNRDTRQLVMLAHLHAQHWKIYGIVFDLNFAAWADGHFNIPEIRDMLKQLKHDYEQRIHGRMISADDFVDILSGETHPGRFLETTKRAAMHWFDDLLDYRHHHSVAESYEALYGTWFTTAQYYFKLYADQEIASSSI
ncbi:helix-turn-helix domain-containing protein [Pseudomonas putida]|uniref:helix-turn-helix domain-containing protein n=1 Tax=Pseudomonas putida TaxID=303 RepID=UPI0039067A77